MLPGDQTDLTTFHDDKFYHEREEERQLNAICPHCRGRGYITEEGNRRYWCPDCDGVGRSVPENTGRTPSNDGGEKAFD